MERALKIYISRAGVFFYYIGMPKKINLLVLTHNFPRYEGDFAGIFISLLVRRLVDFNIQPVVLAPHDPGAAEYEEIDGVKVYRFRYAEHDAEETIAYRGNMHKLVLGSATGAFKFKRFLDCFRRAAFEIIEKEQIDVVSGHWLIPSGLVMKTISQKLGLPMVISSHGTDVRLMRKYFKVTYRYLKKFCLGLNRWTVVSSFLKEAITSLDRRLYDVIEILPVPHDETIFHTDDAIAREGNLVVAVTRFTQQKRVGGLRKAFALVAEKKPGARLELYGTGPLQADIEGLIARFGLQHQVKIIPPVPQAELGTVYNRATMVVLNSWQEGFGLALSEAMLCGAAVIGTRSGGITDIIEHNERGLLVEPDDSSDLAEAIIRLFEDKPLRERLASAGHRFAHETYTSASLASRYADIIRSCVKSD